MTTLTGDTTTPLLTTTTPLIEEGWGRDGQTNEFYLPLTSTVVLKKNFYRRKREENWAAFLRINSVVIDTTNGLIHVPHFTMQFKTVSSETTTKPQPAITDDALAIPIECFLGTVSS